MLEEEALAQARASEARWQAGAPQGLLDGVPVTVKDLCQTIGAPARNGSLTTSDAPGTVDAPCVARLREAGAVLLGKTAMCEFGWKGVTDSPLLGVSRNPWNPQRTCGGSSGGAAIAAATGMGALHVGSDGAGSIRIPAAFCGVFGFKATFGRVPTWPPGRVAVGHYGPLTRTVEDAALMLNVIARPDARDWTALPYVEGTDYRDGLEAGVRGLRIAWCPTLCGARPDDEVLAPHARRGADLRRPRRAGGGDRLADRVAARALRHAVGGEHGADPAQDSAGEACAARSRLQGRGRARPRGHRQCDCSMPPAPGTRTAPR